MADKIVLLIMSSTGQGDIPASGLAFEGMCHDVLANTPSPGNKGFKFEVFGNGDGRYSNTYNGAALKTHSLMKKIGGSSLMRGIWQGDAAAEPLPLRSLSSWWEKLQPSINDVLSASVEASVQGSKPAEDTIQK
ncbi:hypothetical protein ABVK25_005996 [Lepraria finkii]|uniref:Flavodoxin-like domain-containing protein n=1 Tax=Lepraria finkii TaxID=1340010 RepID=A0ABR4B752_9LECA